MSNKNKNQIIGAEDENLSSKVSASIKNNKTSIITLTIAAAVGIILIILALSILATTNSEKAIAAEQKKQELCDIYEKSGVKLNKNKDFTVSEDNDGNVIVEINKDKEEEIQKAKNKRIKAILNDDDSYSTSNQNESEPNQSSDTEESPSPSSSSDENDDEEVEHYQEMIITKINSYLSNIKAYNERSSDSSNHYSLGYNSIIETKRSGGDMSKTYNNQSYSYATAWNKILCQAYTHCVLFDNNTVAWNHSMPDNLTSNCLDNCMTNALYDLQINNVEVIYDIDQAYYFCGTTIKAKYCVFDGYHQYYLLSDYSLVDVF